MQVLVQVPDDLAEKLETSAPDLPRMALEALAIEAHRTGALTSAEVQRLLDLPSRFQVDEFLKRAGSYLDYSEEDLEKDIQAIRRLR